MLFGGGDYFSVLRINYLLKRELTLVTDRRKRGMSMEHKTRRYCTQLEITAIGVLIVIDSS